MNNHISKVKPYCSKTITCCILAALCNFTAFAVSAEELTVTSKYNPGPHTKALIAPGWNPVKRGASPNAYGTGAYSGKTHGGVYAAKTITAALNKDISVYTLARDLVKAAESMAFVATHGVHGPFTSALSVTAPLKGRTENSAMSTERAHAFMNTLPSIALRIHADIISTEPAGMRHYLLRELLMPQIGSAIGVMRQLSKEYGIDENSLPIAELITLNQNLKKSVTPWDGQTRLSRGMYRESKAGSIGWLASFQPDPEKREIVRHLLASLRSGLVHRKIEPISLEELATWLEHNDPDEPGTHFRQQLRSRLKLSPDDEIDSFMPFSAEGLTALRETMNHVDEELGPYALFHLEGDN